MQNNSNQFPEAEIVEAQILDKSTPGSHLWHEGCKFMFDLRIKTSWCDKSWTGYLAAETKDEALREVIKVAKRHHRNLIKKRDDALRAGKGNT